LNINILTIDGMCAYRHFSLQMIRYNDQQLVQVVMCTCKSALLNFRHAQDKGEQIRRLSGVWFLWDPCLIYIYMSCTRTHMHTYTYTLNRVSRTATATSTSKNIRFSQKLQRVSRSPKPFLEVHHSWPK
jgi:hypothetical protein